MGEHDEELVLLRALELIKTQSYLNLATENQGEPWNTPVWAVPDRELNFYWSSWVNAVHSANIRSNPRVFATLYDSSRQRGTNNLRCLYLQCLASTVSDTEEAEQAARLIYPAESVNLGEFLGQGIKRFYKATPLKAWLNCLSERELSPSTIKMRVEVSLEKLKKKI